MTPWLLIPVKSLDAGKSRLAHAFEKEPRRGLNEFFLRRLLRTARVFPGASRTAVISGCRDVLRIAEEHGAWPIRQKIGRGLNAAAAQGLAALRCIGAQDILLIACDEPLVRSADLRDVARRGAKLGGIVICPDKHGTGTNAIYMPSAASIRFQFGEDSLYRHVHEALRSGFVPYVHFNARIALDIDTPIDLVLWRQSSHRKGIADLTGRMRAARLR